MKKRWKGNMQQGIMKRWALFKSFNEIDYINEYN